MKKIIVSISLAAIMLLCGCGADAGSIAIVTTAPDVTPSSPAAPPLASAGIVIPAETKVYAAEGELAAVKSLYESYLTGNDMLAYAVSAVFDSSTYLMGFVYENNEDTLPFSRVIGLKQNGTDIEEAFISDNYENPKGWEPENLYLYQEKPFYDTQTFYLDGNLVVLTNETLSEDETMNNVFVINDKGILCNYVCIPPCRPYLHQDKLFFCEDYIWSELSVQNNEVVLKEITDYTPYRPEVKEGDIVIDLKSLIPGKYDGETDTFSGDNYIELQINDEKFSKEDFDAERENADWGVYNDYYSKNEFNVDIGSNIIILYPPGTQASCYIYDNMLKINDSFEPYRIPGVSVIKASEAGKYVAIIATDCEFYNILIKAE